MPAFAYSRDNHDVIVFTPCSFIALSFCLPNQSLCCIANELNVRFADRSIFLRKKFIR